MLSPEIKTKLNRLWDMFWAGGMTNPLTALEQISYLLFMRRIESLGLIDDDQYKWSFYTTSEQYKDNLPSHMKEVFEYIKTLRADGEPFTMAMDGANFDMTKTSLLDAAIELINEIYDQVEVEKSNGQHFQDTLGDFYELILKQTSEAGKNGQFRTPRHIIQLMCEIIKPTLSDTICDVASGTCGFLVGAYQYIISNNSKEEPILDENGFKRKNSGSQILPDSDDERKLTLNTFFGYDIDKTMIRLGMMNLLMHNIKDPKIKYLDSLSKDFDNIENEVKYSMILANPPFTGRIDSLTVGPELNRVYDLKPKIDKKTGKEKAPAAQSEILFLERIIQLLDINGRAAVIVPEGVLFGSSKAATKIREILLKDCKLEAVISLPSGVFMPYTGVKTSILVFTKKVFNSNIFHTEKVWFYGLESDGYSLDANRKPLKDKPLPDVVYEYDQRYDVPNEDRTKKHFFVDLEQIVAKNYQLGFDQHKKFVHRDYEYHDPKALLAQLFEIEKDIFVGMEELTKMLD